MTKFIKELNDEPLYKITLPGRKAPQVEGYQYPRRGIWTPWEDELEPDSCGFHLIPSEQDLGFRLWRYHVVFGYETLDLWEVESDSVGYRRANIVAVAHRFRLKDRIFQSNKREYQVTESDIGTYTCDILIEKIVKEKLDEHRSKRK